ncbi:MAG TPA: hypothetical protein VFB50_13945 [Chloroflexota bacterium]|nr:hypothetical protein [Chloroflexota bacterium]
MPSVAACEPSFDPEHRTAVTWRGPTWMNSNYYLYWGLRSHGYRDVASELAKRSVQMIGQGGMREFFHPLSGTGQGAVDFSWTALILDLIHAEGWGCGCAREEKSAHLEPFTR